jgi:hypothetical protein
VLILCAIVALLPVASGKSGRGFWLTIAAILALLALYRFLNLEQVVPNEARVVARANDVYDERRLPQALMVSAILIAGSAFALWLVWWRERLSRKAALGMTVALLALYGVRLLSLHMTDSILYASVAGLHLNWAIEGLLLAGLCGAAFYEARKGGPE